MNKNDSGIYAEKSGYFAMQQSINDAEVGKNRFRHPLVFFVILIKLSIKTLVFDIIFGFFEGF